MMSESSLQRSILAYLALVPGLEARRTNSGMARSPTGGWIRLAPAGTPDITGHMPDGRALYIEVKDPTARRSQESARRRAAVAAQEAFIARAAAAGCVAFVARSLDEVAERIGREIAC